MLHRLRQRSRHFSFSPFKKNSLRIPSGVSCSMQALTDAILCKSVTSLTTNMQNPIRNQLKGKTSPRHDSVTHRFKGGGHKHQGKDKWFFFQSSTYILNAAIVERLDCVKQAVDCLHCNHSGLKSECFHLIGGNLLHSKLTPDWSLGLELC